MQPYSSFSLPLLQRKSGGTGGDMTSVSPKELKSPQRACQGASESTRSWWQNRALAFKHNSIPIHHSFLAHTHTHTFIWIHSQIFGSCLHFRHHYVATLVLMLLSALTVFSIVCIVIDHLPLLLFTVYIILYIIKFVISNLTVTSFCKFFMPQLAELDL